MDTRREIRLVTCLFVDVVGSTDATVRLGPERMQRLLDEAFHEMSATITAYGGVVEKYVGDAILALFGAPVSHTDDTERALRAADACVRWLPTSASPAAGLAVRAGVETGDVLVDLGAIEARQRMVVGESINLAARLQQVAEPGQIVVGPTFHDATAALADYERLGSVPLKGLGSVEAWRFAGFRTDAEAPRVELVGRKAELAALRTASERAREGTAVLALIVGPPGQGKSRLAAEALRDAAPARVLEARCRPGIETGANPPLRQLIESDIPGATPEAIHDRVVALIGEPDGRDIAAALSHSSGLAADERLLALARIEQRETIAGAWRRYLEAVAGRSLLCVMIEDVHWADPLLLRVIDQATSDFAAPLIVIATARPEFVGSAHLRPDENRLQIDLGPLDRADVSRLAEVAGEGTPSADTAFDRAAGNPLFVIELARSRSRASKLPVTIQAAIAARLDELTSSERELLQRSSVAGETFDVRDAALLGDREPAEAAAALGRFAHLGFVVPVGHAYRFHHALVHEVAYGRIPIAERMALHARYAVEGKDPSDVEALAHHWWEALKPPDADWVWEDMDRHTAMRRDAFRVHLAAGARLEQRNAYEEALQIYLRAVDLADATPDAAMATSAVGRAYARQGRGDDAWTNRRRAIELYHEAGVTPPAELYADMLEIASFNWGYFHQVPDDAETVRLLDDGTALARASGDDISLARLLAERASMTGDMSGTDEMDRFLHRPDAARFADAVQRMATVYAWAGRIADGVSLFETVFERLIPEGAVINEPEALVWYGMAAFHAGDLRGAETLPDRLQAEAVHRSVHTRSHAFSLKALVLFGRGDWAGLERTTEELRSLVRENPDSSFCLLSGAAVAYGTAARVLAGGHLPADIDEEARRHVEGSERVQAASVLLPKVMAGDDGAIALGLRGYEPGLRLADRYRAWDVADLMPAVALTMLERWQELPRIMGRLDEFASRGARLTEAAAAAIREEEGASLGGPPPAHALLRDLGYLGISDLLRFRPMKGTKDG